MQGVKAKYFVESPLVEGASASLIDTVGREHIISRYRDVYKIDVSDYFCGIESAKVYECQVTGYRFYYPFSLTGKENLYRQLEFTADGKYKDDKWEFRKALTLIEPSSRILDVGCGKGDFVRLAMQAGLIAHGLELNSA